MIPEIIIVALDYYRAPHRFPHLLDLKRPLPSGISDLLAAPGTLFSDERIEETAVTLNASTTECREMVPFFVKHVLIDAGGDYYRMLGLDRQADHSRIKQHYHYLISQFHPDRDLNDESWEAIYAPRLNEAYNTLRNRQKRAEYDRSRDEQREFEFASAPPSAPVQTRVPSPVKAAKQSPLPGHASGFRGRKRYLFALLVLIVGAVSIMLLNKPGQPSLRVQNGDASIRALDPGKFVNPHTADVASEPEVRTESIAEPQSVEPQPKLSLEETVRQRVAKATAEVVPVSARKPSSRPSAAVQTSRQVTRAKSQAVSETRQPASTDSGSGQTSGSMPGNGEQESRSEQSSASTALAGDSGATEQQKTPQAPVVQEVPGPALTSSTMPEVVSIDIQRKPSPGKPTIEQSTGIEGMLAPVSVEVVALSADADGKRSDTTVIDAGSEPTRVAASETMDSLISQQQLIKLMAGMISSFEQGDLDAFVALFAENARTRDAVGKADISTHYERYFNRPESRRMILSGFQWKDTSPRIKSGEGDLKLVIMPDAASAAAVSSISRLDLGVKLEGSGLKITYMHY